jgi:ABC-type nickel/cobalt efflux system permease component RcnA
MYGLHHLSTKWINTHMFSLKQFALVSAVSLAVFKMSIGSILSLFSVALLAVHVHNMYVCCMLSHSLYDRSYGASYTPMTGSTDEGKTHVP